MRGFVSTSLLVLGVGALLALPSSRASGGVLSSDVATFAGSGTAGNADGPVAVATFSSPASIAVAPDGDVYVADRALNTIRLIHDGNVTTIVGRAEGDPLWRRGGYRDGPGPDALLNHPEAIALAPDGSLVIADSWNACLRRYANGSVTTLAGAPTRFGYADGPALRAEFKNPTALAIDTRGTVFVADRDDPVRSVAPDGTVSSLTLATKGIVLGLATAPPDKLFIADEDGLLETNTVPGTPGLRLGNFRSVRETATVEAGAPLGHPAALAAANDHVVAYSDLLDDSIGLAVVTRVERIAGTPVADPNEAGGFADGPALQARFNAPKGLARYGSGWLVADMGNHRIRYVPGVDTRNPVSPNAVGELDAYTNRHRPELLVVGNSEVSFDTNYGDSIAGHLAPLEPSFDVIPMALVGVDDPALIGNWLADGYDLEARAGAAVVYVFDDAGITTHGTTLYADLAAGGAWTEKLVRAFATLRRDCGNAKVTVIDIPLGLEAGPSETALAQRYYASTSSEWPHIDAMHSLVVAAARKSGVRYVDLWPAFRAIDAAGGGPLYHPFDAHLTAIGRARLARLIADSIAR